MNFLRGFSFNAGCMLAAMALSLANQRLLARGLGAEGYGVLGWWLTAVLVATQVCGEWLGRGNLYEVGRLRQSRQVAGNTLLYVGALAPVLVGLGLGLEGLLTPLVPALPYLPWMAAGLVVLSVLQKTGEGILQGEDRVRAYSLVPVVFVGCYLVGNLWVLEGLGGGLRQVFFAWAAALGLAALVAWALVGRGGLGLDLGLFRRAARTGSRGGPAFILVSLLFSLDMFIVEGIWGSGDELGLYRLAFMLVLLLQRPLNVAGTVLLPKVIRSADGEDALSVRVAQGALWFAALAAAGLALVGRPLIEWVFDPSYSAAYGPLLWLLPGLVLSGCGSVFNTRLYGQGYPPVTLWAPAVALACKLGLNAWFALAFPVLGLEGVALATSLSHGIWAAIVAWYFFRLTGVSPRLLLKPFWR